MTYKEEIDMIKLLLSVWFESDAKTCANLISVCELWPEDIRRKTAAGIEYCDEYINSARKYFPIDSNSNRNIKRRKLIYFKNRFLTYKAGSEWFCIREALEDMISEVS